MTVKLEVNVAGIRMVNPVMLASGIIGYGAEYTKIEGFSNDDFGAIVLKGTTLKKRLGNPPQRLASSYLGILNSIGLQNPGIDYVLEKLVPKLRQYKTNILLNISGSEEAEYRKIAEKVGKGEGIHGLEVNISCPNVKSGGMQFGSDPDSSFRVIEGVKKATDLPVIAKLSPNVTDIKLIAKACIDAGADALSLINTVKAMAIDIETKRPKLGANFGGLSGPAIKPVAIYNVFQAYQVAKRFQIPLIGVGGIQDEEDIIEFILAGASAVQIGTSLLVYDMKPNTLIKNLEKKLEQMRIGDINELVGKVNLHP